MHNKKGFIIGPLETNQLFILHYAVNSGALRKKAKRMAEFQPGFDWEKWIEDFHEKYDLPTVIWPFHTEGTEFPILIGRRPLQQEVVDYMKSDPKNVSHLFYELRIFPFVPVDDYDLGKNTKAIHIYDLLCKPREIKFTLV